MIWNPEYESIDRAGLREIQLQRLIWTLKWVYERVPHYKKKFDGAGVNFRNLRKIDELIHFPFSSKEDFRDNYPFGMFALPMDEVVRVHSSSGTTGKPIVAGYSRGDLNIWAEMTARIASAAGVTSNDIAQISFGYGLFTGGFGLHHGLERIGASVIPVSAGNTERQVQLMRDFGSTALIATPSYALHIAEIGKEMGIDFQRLPLRVGLFGAEPWSENMRREIEERMDINATDNYGLTEIIGPGVSGECPEKNGLHINEDHFLVEVIDPESGENKAVGETGELVITPLTKEACPVVRFRTRDLTYLMDDPCRCGRTTIRMARVLGRTDDMMIIRGVNVFPSQIESALIEIDGVEPHYQIILERKGSIDQVEVQVEVSETIFEDEMKKLIEMEKKVESKLLSATGIRANIKFVEPKKIERTAGKAKRVIDRRKI